MKTKQISLTMPENLFLASSRCYQDCGYKNLQELILDILRRRILDESSQRYRIIENEMKKGKSRKLNQREAVKYVRDL
ncbi:MAG: hypothetical protein V1659_04935 [Candidatus Woesearchaeota archaeon]